MTFSTAIEKASDKPHTFDKNLIKDIYRKHIGNIFNGETLNAFYLRSGIRQALSALPTSFNIVLAVLASIIQQGKEIKGNIEGKKRNITLFIHRQYEEEQRKS